MLGFLFAPLAGRWSHAGSSIYLVQGQGEQWALLVLPLVAAFLVYLRRWGWATGTAGVLFVAALISVARILQAPDPWVRPIYAAPGPLHLLALSAGVLCLLASSIWGMVASDSDADSAAWQGQPSRAVSAPRTSFLESIDWGFWGIAVLSLLVWPLGMVLFFSYSRNGDDKASAALIGACTGLLLFLIRLLGTMVKVGS